MTLASDPSSTALVVTLTQGAIDNGYICIGRGQFAFFPADAVPAAIKSNQYQVSPVSHFISAPYLITLSNPSQSHVTTAHAWWHTEWHIQFSRRLPDGDPHRYQSS